jgi:uncharacterized coiled-coil protein SlyX
MAQQESFVEESIDRVQSAMRSVEDEFEKIQRNIQDRRKSFEKQTRKQVKRLRSEFRKNPLVKRAEEIRADAVNQIESSVDSLLDWLPVASRADLRKIDRKLNQLTKKLKTLEKSQASEAAQKQPASRSASL